MTPPPADLLPCPFCNHVLPIARGDDGTYWVQCVGCGALGPTRSHRADAVAAWNRRPQPIAGAQPAGAELPSLVWLLTWLQDIGRHVEDHPVSWTITCSPQQARDAAARITAALAQPAQGDVVERVAEAARGLFVGGFIEAGAKQESEWSAELARRLEPLRVALSALPAVKQGVGEWRPIETAPRDVPIICCCEGYLPFEAEWDRTYGKFIAASGHDLGPTHWQPMPPRMALMSAGAGRE
jgi:hypothetical protein